MSQVIAIEKKIGGTNLYCPYCGEIQECRQLPPSKLGLKGGQRLFNPEHTDIQWFRRGRECLTCRNIFVTAELDEDFLEELIKLRTALGPIKLNAEQYLKESKAAARTLEKLSTSLSVLRALDIYQEE
jgi:hypothetical protein